MAPACGKGSSVVLMVDAMLVEALKNLAARGTHVGIVVFVALRVCANSVVILSSHAA